jgi:hypothetical protein
MGRASRNLSCLGLLSHAFPASAGSMEEMDHCSYLGLSIGPKWHSWVCDAIWNASRCNEFDPLVS